DIGIAKLNDYESWPSFNHSLRNWAQAEGLLIHLDDPLYMEDLLHPSYLTRLTRDSKVRQAINANLAKKPYDMVIEDPNAQKTAFELYRYLKQFFGSGSQRAILKISMSLKNILHDEMDEPAYFVTRSVNLYNVLRDSGKSDYANEEHLVRHLVDRLRASAHAGNKIWTSSRIDSLNSTTTTKDLLSKMDEAYRSYIYDQANSITALNTTVDSKRRTGTGQTGSGRQMKGPDEALKKKSPANSIGKTGYRFGQLKAMTPAQRQKIVKAANLTCNNCDAVGHISLDCSKAKNSDARISETQTNYKALFAGISEEDIKAFIASKRKEADDKPITAMNTFVLSPDNAAELSNDSDAESTVSVSHKRGGVSSILLHLQHILFRHLTKASLNGFLTLG
ncbi:hypothetical protein HDU67_003883, partial [Dinochytrium kinnereticum]